MSDSFGRERDRVLQRVRAFIDRFGEPARRALDEVLRERRTGGSPSAAAGKVDRSRYPCILGRSRAILEVLALVDRVAPSDLPVLVQGESGTGKELVARAIHVNSPRRDKAFVSENCAAIPETLQESELFGYKRGAFTGAHKERKGLFEVADGGTLFLDEVGDMSPAMQKKLLRVLQDGEVRPIGGNRSIHVDVRIVSASNRLLTDLVRDGKFREDLYYRLAGVTITLPPLRERREDIALLARAFVESIAGEMGRAPPVLSDEAVALLEAHRWPGNVRELENEMRRCLALMGDGDVIGPEELGDEVRGALQDR